MGFYLEVNDTHKYINSAYLRYIILNSNEIPSKMEIDYSTLITEQNVLEKLNVPLVTKSSKDIIEAISSIFEDDTDYSETMSTLLTFNKSTILAIYYIYLYSVQLENTNSPYETIKKIIASSNSKDRTEMIISALMTIDDEKEIKIFDNLEKKISELTINPGDTINDSTYANLNNCMIPYKFHGFNPVAFYLGDPAFGFSPLKFCRNILLSDQIANMQSATNADTSFNSQYFLAYTFLKKFSLRNFKDKYYPTNQGYFNDTGDLASAFRLIGISDSDDIIDYARQAYDKYSFSERHANMSEYEFICNVSYRFFLVAMLNQFFKDISHDTNSGYGHWYFDLNEADQDSAYNTAKTNFYNSEYNKFRTDTSYQKKFDKSLDKFNANVNKALSFVKKDGLPTSTSIGLFQAAYSSTSEDYRPFFRKRWYLDASTVFEDICMRRLHEIIVDDYNIRENISDLNRYDYTKTDWEMPFDDLDRELYAVHYNNLANKVNRFHRARLNNTTAITVPTNILSQIRKFINPNNSTVHYQDLRTDTTTHYIDGCLSTPNLENLSGDADKKITFTINSNDTINFSFNNSYITSQTLANSIYKHRDNFSDRNSDIRDKTYSFTINKIDTKKDWDYKDYHTPDKITEIEELKASYTESTSFSNTSHSSLLNSYHSWSGISASPIDALDFIIGDDGTFISLGFNTKPLVYVLNALIGRISKNYNDFNINDLASVNSIKNEFLKTNGDIDTAIKEYREGLGNSITDNDKICLYYAERILRNYIEYLFNSNIPATYNYFSIIDDITNPNINSAATKNMLELYKTIFYFRHMKLDGKIVFDKVKTMFENKIDLFISDGINEYINFYLSPLRNDYYVTNYTSSMKSWNKSLYNKYIQYRNLVVGALEDSSCVIYE